MIHTIQKKSIFREFEVGEEVRRIGGLGISEIRQGAGGGREQVVKICKTILFYNVTKYFFLLTNFTIFLFTNKFDI